MADDDITPAPAYDETAPAADGAPAAAVAAKTKPGRATGALICGILSLLVVLVIPIIGIVLGGVAITLGVLARKEIAASPELEGDGLALAGVITGAISLVLAIVFIVIFVAVS